MSTDYTKMLIHSLDHFFNQPNIAVKNEVFAPCFVAHVPMMPPLNQSGFRTFVQGLYTALPDLHMDIDDSIVICNRLVLRTTFCGTHRGSFLGIPATGLHITLPSISIFRTEQDLLVENWTEMDIFGVIQQMSSCPFSSAGVLPSVN